MHGTVNVTTYSDSVSVQCSNQDLWSLHPLLELHSWNQGVQSIKCLSGLDTISTNLVNSQMDPIYSGRTSCGIVLYVAAFQIPY